MKLLLHMCCAPCSVYPLEVLRDKGFLIEGLFYNPNIHPMEEFERRKNTVIQFAGITQLKVNYFDDFLQKEWEAFKGAEYERCLMCYALRLEKTARFAADNGFEAFSTTLLVSPYQKHDEIIALGRKLSDKYSIQFYYEDFRTGFRKGQQKAKEMGLYRQKYCGCILSFTSRLQNN